VAWRATRNRIESSAVRIFIELTALPEFLHNTAVDTMRFSVFAGFASILNKMKIQKDVIECL
jgi:hypothetical protein